MLSASLQFDKNFLKNFHFLWNKIGILSSILFNGTFCIRQYLKYEANYESEITSSHCRN